MFQLAAFETCICIRVNSHIVCSTRNTTPTLHMQLAFKRISAPFRGPRRARGKGIYIDVIRV